MGLDTSHNAWHGAYSSFSHWRDALCNAAGWTLEPTKYEDGFKASWPKEIDAESLTEENFQGKWDQWPDDPLLQRSIIAPEGIDKDVQAFYVGVFDKVYKSDEWQTYLNKKGLIPGWLTGQALTDYFIAEREAHRKMLMAAGEIK